MTQGRNESEPTTGRVRIKAIASDLEAATYDEVRLAENCGTPKLLFDYYDLRTALLGARAFSFKREDRWRVNAQALKEPSLVVSAMLASGRLGQFSLLPPHQSEMLRNLEEKPEFAPGEGWDVSERRFVEDAGLGGWVAEMRERGSLSVKGGWRNRIRHDYGVSRYAYSVLQFAGGSWVERLQNWLDCKLIDVDIASLAYDEALAEGCLSEVADAFGRIRGAGRRINDFNDAVALIMVVRMAEAALADSKGFPRFFDSRGMFAAVASFVPEVDATMKGLDARGAGSPFVGHHYFLYSAIVGSRVGAVGSVKGLAERFPIVDALSSLKLDRLADGEKAQEVADAAEDLFDLGFYRSVWLPALEGREFALLVDGIGVVTSGRQRFVSAYRDVLNEARGVLVEAAQSYSLIAKTWARLEHRVGELRVNHADGGALVEGGSQFAHQLGLARFAMPSAVCVQVAGILRAVLSSKYQGRGFTRDREWLELIGHVGRARNSVESARIAGGVLWCLREFDGVVAVLGGGHCEDDVVALMVTAALLVYAPERPNCEERLQLAGRLFPKLVERLEQSAERFEGSGAIEEGWRALVIARCLGYLSFQEWASRQPDRARAIPRLVEGAGHVEGEFLIERALRYVELAKELAGSALLRAQIGLSSREWLELDASLCNQELYYGVTVARRGRLGRLLDAARRFVRCNVDLGEDWPATYDDTLARYYCIEADCVAHERDQWYVLIEMARAKAIAAARRLPEDPVVAALPVELRVLVQSQLDVDPGLD